MEIRDATLADAAAAVNVLRRSIVDLCVADHRNDRDILASWLANKTIENFANWIIQPNNSVLVALDEGQIVAVGSVRNSGAIELNYVSPDARFRGVSRTLLKALENRARELGNTRCVLHSTETARRFYLSNGYAEIRHAVGALGASSEAPMEKELTC